MCPAGLQNLGYQIDRQLGRRHRATVVVEEAVVLCYFVCLVQIARSEYTKLSAALFGLKTSKTYWLVLYLRIWVFQEARRCGEGKRFPMLCLEGPPEGGPTDFRCLYPQVSVQYIELQLCIQLNFHLNISILPGTSLD